MLVGPNGGHQQSFAVHEGLLKGRSEFFTNALKSECFKEGIERMIPMPEDEPDIFAVYLQLLYRPDLMSVNNKLVGEELEHEYTCLAKTYVLADKLIDATTKYRVFSALKVLTEIPSIPFISLPAVRIIYDGTPCNDSARALVVEWFVHHGEGAWFDCLKDDEHGDFFRDLAFAFGTRRALPGAFEKATGEAKKFKKERDDLKVKVEDKDKKIRELEKKVKDLKNSDKTKKNWSELAAA